MRRKTVKKTIGVDIGGTKMRGVLWNGKKVLRIYKANTPRNSADFKSAFLKIIKNLGRADNISVGAAGIVEKNKLLKSPNIPYIKNFNFFSIKNKDLKSEKLDNDARCFGRAEYFNMKGRNTALFIILGTGVGRALAKHGKILKIKKFEYPEIWEKEYQKIRDLKNDQKLAEYLGKKITELAKPCKPDTIVVGGGVLKRKGFFKKLKKNINLPIKKAVLRDNAVAVGAAMLY